MMPMVRRALVIALSVCLAATLSAGGSPARAAQPATRAALPSDRLHFGLSNLDQTWMTSSGVPWRYRFQYLSGGVNTTHGWETWQDPALPPGQFAVDYMKNSTTAPAGYIPVFTYYELLQSNPSTGGNESARDFSNLNNAATMNAYYANFKLLMQKAGAYGAQVVVHVEPDFWGYMQQRAAGGGASAITAQVKSSNFAEAAAYPDNLVGFTSELKFLRDTYAPNALLAMHASMWSSGIDIASNTDPSVNAAAEADKTAAFLNSAGMWDVVFNDVDDHNAAWWELASCGTPPCVNQYFTHWWDPANVKFPNFSRYLAWVAELHTQTVRPQVVWQVPMGNQYFLTMNNTCGHYQDNVAPYFIPHANDLFTAGLVAVLFGGGNACQTDYSDASKDGVTNNGGRATTDLLGGCNGCNTHPSTWADDDGGYLRIFVGQYYGCKSASATPNLPSPQSPGTTVIITAASTGCASPSYEFWLQYPNGTWVLKQGFGGGQTWNWDTTGYPLGNYTLHLWANQAGDPTATYEAFGSLSYALKGCTSASLSPAAPNQPAGSSVAFTGGATGCSAPQYEYWVKLLNGSWYMKRGFSADPSWSWDTTGLAPGTYTVHVWANQAGDSTATWEAYASSSVTLTGCTSATLSPPSGTSRVGTSVLFTATGSGGCPNPVYEFWLQDTLGHWHLMQGFGGNAWIWTSAGYGKGVYHVHVWANQQGAYAGSWEAYASSMWTLT